MGDGQIRVKNITLVACGEEARMGSKNKSRRHLGSCLGPGPSDGSLDEGRNWSHFQRLLRPHPPGLLHFASVTFPESQSPRLSQSLHLPSDTPLRHFSPGNLQKQ